MIVTTATLFPFVSSFHRPRLRPPCHRRAVLLLVRSAVSSSSSSSWEEREEARWLREEQRWLREEQRWLREESRWRAEREALLSEITALHLRLRALEPLPDAATAPVPPPPPAPKPKPAAPVSPPPPPAPAARVAPPPPPPKPAAPVPPPPPKPAARVPPPPPKPATRVPPPPPPKPTPAPVVEVRKEVVVVEDKAKAKPKAGSSSGKRRALRTGSEGEEVRAMQEALEKLGFYSGEEDTEFSSFSTGTERAVKTWQASIGATEDGLMTSELLERLFTGNIGEDIKKVGLNGALVPSAPETAEIQPPVVKQDFNKHRVYLLGENRWEDPSRLTNRNKPVSGATTASTTKQCITCRGEGRLLCLECDGTGEPNIEPQFLEWVGEDTKCPYCEGLGYTICDACEGSKTVKS